jgi:hypothetical protein
MAYSKDYQRSTVNCKQAGHTFRDFKEAFKITPRAYCQWAGNFKASGNAKAKTTQTRNRP